jgi:hypothetical protein
MRETRVERHEDGSATEWTYEDGRLVEKRNVPARKRKAWMRDGGVWRTSQNWALERADRMKREGVK